jgi:tRNA pseudouridine55 synthase
MNGILIVDKPTGVTSADVVRSIKRRVGVKVGHLGTLDPFASGLLPLCLGEATKIAQFLNTASKSYEGIIQLGAATDTGDCTGTVTRTVPLVPLEPATLQEVAQRFVGPSWQVPPMYSALKRDGVPLYKLARKGIEVEREAREIAIESLHLVPIEDGQLRFAVACSKGTYVRVLAEDIGRALGTVAHLQTLRRTRFGSFDLSQAVNPASWHPAGSTPVSIRSALAHLPCVELDGAAEAAVRRGQGWVLSGVVRQVQGPIAVLVSKTGGVAAIVERRDGRWYFARVLQPGQTLQGTARMVGTHSK